MTNISSSQLRDLARQGDVELRVGVGDNQQKQLQTSEGSWGGRLIRNLTVLFGTPKTGGYTEAKTEVLNTLKSMYGEEIGTKVFRANIGVMEDGVHLSSRAHPITGRHIRQMIEQGDRELLSTSSRGNDYLLKRQYDVGGEVKNELTDYFRSEAQKEKVRFGEFDVANQFKIDLHRSNTQITQQGSSTVLDPANWQTQLTRLVGDCNDQELRTGVFNLTAMLNQSLGNAMAAVGIVNSLPDMGGPPLTAGSFMQRVTLDKDETTGMIRIDVLYSQPYSELQTPDLPKQPLDTRSRLHSSVSFEISSEDLRRPNGFEQVRLIGEPDVRLELISQVGPRDDRDPDGVNHKNIALFQDDGRLVSQAVGDTGTQVRILGECMREDVSRVGGDEPRLRELPGLDETGVNALSFLLAPSTGQGLHETLMQETLRDPDFKLGQDRPPPLTTTVTPIVLKDGTQTLEIEYRGVIPEGLLETHPGTVLHHMGEEPEVRFGFETVVRIRVPVEQLNQGNTGTFEFVHPSRIEGRSIQI